MENLSPLAQKVLDALEPDKQKQTELIEDRPLSSCSQSKAVRDFAKRILLAKERNEKVLIAGDYDADGVFSTSILRLALDKLGIRAGFYIPNRIREGYGLKPETLELAAKKGYTLCITVDNGVKAYDAIAKAKELGMDLVITDHHTIDYEEDGSIDSHLKDLIVVHPDLMEEQFSTLCGAGVIFECVRALGVDDETMLSFAACASVTDVMPMRKETRAIVKNGLKIMNDRTKVPVVLDILVDGKRIDEQTIGFTIGPKINSFGRLADRADVNRLVFFLTAPLMDTDKTMRWKLEIDQMNETRKNMTDQIMKRTELQIKLTKPVIMLALQDCHEGLIGIAAGRYEKKMLKPVIIGSISDGTIKCSMRAPKGFDCMKLLGGFDKLTACGGHARAAGFSLKESDWPEFEKYCQDTVRNLDWQPVPDLHLAISEEECTFENIDSLDLLRPFGEEFKMPVFVIENPQIVSTFDLREGKHRKFQLAKGLEVLNFNQSSEDYQAKPETIASFGGRLQTQIFMGSRKCSLYADEITYRAL